jgi:Skp family chaperone for outer membrane proteins
VADVDSAVKGSKAAEAALASWHAEKAAVGKALEKKAQALNDRLDALDRRADAVTGKEKAYPALAARFLEDKSALQRDVGLFREEAAQATRDFQAKMDKALDPVHSRAVKEAAALAKARGWLALVDSCMKDPAEAFAPGLKVEIATQDVTKALDASSSGKNPPAPPGAGGGPSGGKASAGAVAILQADAVLDTSLEARRLNERLKSGVSANRDLLSQGGHEAKALEGRLYGDFQQSRARLLDKALPIASAIARRHGSLALVKACRADAVLYAAPGAKILDITQEAVKELDSGEDK